MSLVLADVGVRYGGVDALSAVSVIVRPGSVLGLIGPNGAGKTTLVNAATGLTPLSSGTVTLDGVRSTGSLRIASPAPASHGPIRTSVCSRRSTCARTSPQAASPVRDASARRRCASCSSASRSPTSIHARKPVPSPTATNAASKIARALAAQPRILMLDEPAAGMNPGESGRLVETIRGIAASGIGVLLIEHDITLVRAVCDDVVVLNFGVVIAHGTPTAISSDPVVIEAYLGSDAER